MTEKSNEIPAVRDLLNAFAGLAHCVITLDAMHTQADTAQVILGRHADYVMTVKGNMPTLYRQPPPRPRPTADVKPAPGPMNDFAGSRGSVRTYMWCGSSPSCLR